MTTIVEAKSNRVSGGVAGFTVQLDSSFERALPTWMRMADTDSALAFHHRDWLLAWANTLGRRPGTTPIAATVRDASGTPVMGLPLVSFRQGACRRIEFADAGLADYNAPILPANTPKDSASAKQIWRALLQALPACDLIALQRMPRRVGSLVNPLTLLPGTRPAPICGLALDMPGPFAAWRQALPRRYRMELGRCGRLFAALPGARFERVTTDGAAVFTALETLQRERIDALGLPYVLDQHDVRDFYRTLSRDPMTGPGVLTALRTDSGIVAALFGIRHGASFIMLRIGADGAHSRLSPARHLIVETIEQLAADGVSRFDFGLGDYVYKRKLGGTPIELHELVIARSAFGLPEAAAFRLKAKARTMPGLRAAMARARKPMADSPA